MPEWRKAGDPVKRIYVAALSLGVLPLAALSLGVLPLVAHAQPSPAEQTQSPARTAAESPPGSVDPPSATERAPTLAGAAPIANTPEPAASLAHADAEASLAHADAESSLTEPPVAAPARGEVGPERSAVGSPPILALSMAELESLGLKAGQAGLDKSFHFSGFTDFTAYVPIRPRGGAYVLLPKQSTFYIGNLNLYISKNLSEDFRTMGEIRFTYLPNGALDSSDKTKLGYVDTTTWDYADNSRFTRWGGIMIQRMYLEWTLHPSAVLRIGHYLTPYGIWNVDHGSPAYVPVQRPYAITNNWFPQQQTGFELFGTFDLNGANMLGYHFTFSNGGGPISEYRDLDANKAVGGRLFLEHRGAGTLRFGGSGYYGRDTNTLPTFVLKNDILEVGESFRHQFDSLNLAADIRYVYKWLHLQAEWMSQQRRFTDRGRVLHEFFLAKESHGFSRDSLSWSGYAMAAATLPWYALTPYVVFQYTDDTLEGFSRGSKMRLVYAAGGLNLHPIDEVTFKAEYSHGIFLRKSEFFYYSTNTLQFQTAWAF